MGFVYPWGQKTDYLLYIKNDEHFLGEYPLWAGARDVDDQG